MPDARAGNATAGGAVLVEPRGGLALPAAGSHR